MTSGLTLMFVSGLVMVLLLVHKHLETTRGIRTRVQEVRSKADPVLSEVRNTAHEAYSKVTFHNSILLANRTLVEVVKFFMHISSKAHSVSSSIVERASKKTEDLSKGGAASFYLKQIKDAKENGVGGK